MRNAMLRLPVLAAALWWGSLTTLGFMVVPLLFAHLPSPAIAGAMAAKLFSAQTWLSLGCGLVLLITVRLNQSHAGLKPGQTALIVVAVTLLLAVLSEFAVAPRIMARENLKLWHGVGSALYGLQWLGSWVVLWRLARSVSLGDLSKR